MQPNVEVPVGEITSREWTQLTLGIWWRLAVLSLVTSVLGSAASVAILYPVSKALGPAIEQDGTIIMLLSVAGGVLLSIGAAHWFLRWIITVQYGDTRLAVLRGSASPEGI
jgi:hypothetical protein